MLARALVAAAVLTAGAATPARAAAWRWPVRGEVVGRFHYGADPFAAGQRRGIQLRARAGTPVRAACAGRVTFAGDVPRASGTVSVACGGLVATYLHLGAIAVVAGERVRRGDRVGAVGERGLYLGARRRGSRFGYVDPLTLLGEARAPRPVSILLGRAPRGGPVTPFRPGAPPVARVPLESARAAVPAAAWVGLALAAVALPPLGLRRRRRRQRVCASAATPAPGSS